MTIARDTEISHVVYWNRSWRHYNLLMFGLCQLFTSNDYC
jgi:hypothetical protein